MECRQAGIQAQFDRLTSYANEKRECVKIERSRPIFIRDVFKRVDSNITFNLGPPEKVRQVLSEWADGRHLSMWMSEWLPVHLDLPVYEYPEDCCILQGVVLGEGLPLLFLTLHTQDSVDQDPRKSVHRLEEMRGFGTKCARVLTLSLLNFCHREFLVLPCTMSYEDFTARALQTEVEDRLREARQFYGGPEMLGQATCEDLVKAVSVAATATTLPCYLGDERDPNKDWLVLMDRDWDRAMRDVINTMLGNSQVTVTYTPLTEFKTKSAVLEAAKRISYSRRVVVVTSNDRVHAAVRLLAQVAQEENGLDPDCFRSAHPADSFPQADCVIAVDVDDVTTLQTENLKMMVLKQPTKRDKEERVRILLLGRSGSGKSATANSLLGQACFESSVSFTAITTANTLLGQACFESSVSFTTANTLLGQACFESSVSFTTANTLLGQACFESSVSFTAITTASGTRRRTYHGKVLEVVDSPGVRDVTHDKGLDMDYFSQGEADSGLGFDVICYVMRIERFTEEEDKVFWRFLDVLGPSVLHHMVLVFTCGDRIPKDDSITSILAQAPERLKKIVELCQQRFVVFDNISPGNQSQIDEFFETAKRIDSSKPFFCPSAAVMEDNWEQSCEADRQQRWTMLTKLEKEEYQR